ncbi:hypothetical protein [Mangrovimonas futianensis]|uniref:hypothetical protein n=1 Tax=Mangrovimonas futianensis TaxID=2895523 RepID=UPI001E57FD40|nr:hypothetical protein [Mangrovimonas futianensis]MCF1423092.1 hypothetical protein [Mangrovimonas futianensis]
MRIPSIVIVLLIFVTACKSNEKETPKEKKVYDMYEFSEMALLMEQMYGHNQRIKQEILEGKIPTTFPVDFLRIHSAEMTKPEERNANFEAFSKVFLEAQKEIFNDSSKVSLPDRFNTMVDACISCHQTSCTGPIPRINKLRIQ